MIFRRLKKEKSNTHTMGSSAEEKSGLIYFLLRKSNTSLRQYEANDIYLEIFVLFSESSSFG
jgi:hypothetical protein